MKETLEVYDATLRDGAQAEGIAYSLEDKLLIARRLDRLGVHYIEGGWPNPTNPKDLAFFREVKKLGLRARVTAFGSTRQGRQSQRPRRTRPSTPCCRRRPESVCIFGKSWTLHVTEALKTSPEENLELIEDSVAYLCAHGREVIYDAEHYFDGYCDDPEYALETLRAAARGGARVLVLCDTNGGRLPSEVSRIFAATRDAVSLPLGIHTHNDSPAWPRPTRWPPRSWGRSRCREPSTATGNGAATPTCAR